MLLTSRQKNALVLFYAYFEVDIKILETLEVPAFMNFNSGVIFTDQSDNRSRPSRQPRKYQLSFVHKKTGEREEHIFDSPYDLSIAFANYAVDMVPHLRAEDKFNLTLESYSEVKSV